MPSPVSVRPAVSGFGDGRTVVLSLTPSALPRMPSALPGVVENGALVVGVHLQPHRAGDDEVGADRHRERARAHGHQAGRQQRRAQQRGHGRPCPQALSSVHRRSPLGILVVEGEAAGDALRAVLPKGCTITVIGDDARRAGVPHCEHVSCRRWQSHGATL